MWIALIVIGALLVFGVALYNTLTASRNRVEEAWSDIEVQLKRRYDLIPNIVESVKGYAKHETGVFEEVTKARSAAMNAGSMEEKLKDENMLSGALRHLFAVAEAYPDLKANANFLQLQGELVDTENKIQAARRFYNGNVRDYNTKLQVFPNNLLASSFGFTAKAFFDIDEKGPEGQPVKVQF